MRPHDSIAETHVGSDYTDDEREFLVALERYRQSKQRRFPSCREILQVITELGYRKKAGSGQIDNDTDAKSIDCAATKRRRRKALPIIAKPGNEH